MESGDKAVNSPLDFVKDVSSKVSDNAQFFISYVSVSGGMQVFFRLSQLHNLVMYWFVTSVVREEAASERRLEHLRTDLKVCNRLTPVFRFRSLTSSLATRRLLQAFHLDEFIPLFLFIFMVGALYSALAPLSCLFVAAFFAVAYKVFKYMCLFVYGNRYEGGGFLFYTLTSILFMILYFIILLIAGYFSIHASSAITGLFLLLIPITVVVHMKVFRTFVAPSRTLSLAKARHFDAQSTSFSLREEKVREIQRLQQQVQDMDEQESSDMPQAHVPLLPISQGFDHRRTVSTESSYSFHDASVSDLPEDQKQKALENMRQRYGASADSDDAVSDFTDSDRNADTGRSEAFFIYRQPSLNRATWEIEPRPYRTSGTKNNLVAGELWR